MNKSVFYGIGLILAAISFSCLTVSSSHGKPEEAFGILIAVLLVTTLLFIIEENQNLVVFLLLLALVAFGAIILGVVDGMIGASGSDSLSVENIHTWWILGIRWASLIWPFIVLKIGDDRYDVKSQKEKAKAEQKL